MTMLKRWRVTADVRHSLLVEAAVVMRAGGVVAYPTDTLYGLGADPWNEAAVDKVFAIKGRDAGQALPLIAADAAQVEAHLGVLSPLALRLANAFWPGPLTLVVPAPPTLPATVLGGTRGIAVRVPAHEVASGLARALGRPLVSTSANRSGQPATADPDEVARSLGAELDGLIDAGPAPGGPPSTIVDVCERPRLVRAGAVAWDRVVQFLA